MEAQSRLFQEEPLDNGLTVFFYDESRPIAGNRWQVRLKIVIPVTVREEYFEKLPDPLLAYRELTSALGGTIHFTLEKVRNFIGDDEASVLIEEMQSEFLNANRAYVSSPRFAHRYILKKYVEWKEEEGSRQKHLEAMRGLDPES